MWVGAACTGSSPAWTATPDRASVGTCVAGASDGDTVSVTAGDSSETWTTPLVITKGIKLIGPGAAALTITNSYACDPQHSTMIVYTPTDFSYDASATTYSFRLSGFTLDGGAVCSIIDLNVSGSNTPQTKVRIDHNIFQNTKPSDSTYGVSIVNRGAWGVVDNNTLSGYIPARNGNGGDKAWWDNWNGIVYGSSQNLYYEDNIINSEGGIVSNCQYADRYAFRYNTITMTDSAYPMFDLHGNGAGYYSCFGGEVYGNNVATTFAQKFNQQRGGKMIVALNNCTNCGGAFYTQVRQESYGERVTDNDCVDQDGTATHCALDGAHQYVNDSYYWANRINYTTDDDSGATDVSSTCGAYVEGNGCQPPALNTPLGGRDFFDITTTPAIVCGASKGGTCTTGQIYFETAQSCSSLENMVGKTPSTPIDGTLYTCTAANTWTAKWTPYTYPHPLRGESTPATYPTATIGSGPSATIGVGPVCTIY
jgi:hypothetical protein